MDQPLGVLGDAALSAFPGPALILDDNGQVLSANARSDALRQAISQDILPSLKTLLLPGIQPRQPVVEPLAAPCGV